ncbi:site-specific integrase [Nocardia sp. NBC_01009]|uniref:site-specific integrase n=1 Tax=Nocardia sp. NBC_01009 TaxID=2975996 RepID=UPI003867AF70|nr:site-specific integrase [Nocardia sp. NBC_01009]
MGQQVLVEFSVVPTERSSQAATHVAVARIGKVVPGEDASLPWLVLDAAGAEIPEAGEYLRYTVVNDFSPNSVESYARALLRWLRFLWATDVDWDRADRNQVRDFVLWMRTTVKERERRTDAPVPGSVNPRTGKQYPGWGFAQTTMNHNLAVVSSFYDYFIDQGRGPLRNPVPPSTGPQGARAGGHHNPMDPFRPRRRAAYRQQVPRVQPRGIPDQQFNELFERMPSHRDRAILALYVSTAARPEVPPLSRRALSMVR